jgi:catechol 2,3-dioxygenase-like lactoylglutathione lyase family enzyme
MARWECVVPQLPVRDVPAAQAWYRDMLGLDINWIWDNDFGSVGRHHVELFLYASDDPQRAYVSFFVDDVDAVYEACRASGGEIVSPLEQKPWNVREFSLRDADGHVLRIGTGVETDEEPRESTMLEKEATR